MDKFKQAAVILNKEKKIEKSKNLSTDYSTKNCNTFIIALFLSHP